MTTGECTDYVQGLVKSRGPNVKVLNDNLNETALHRALASRSKVVVLTYSTIAPREFLSEAAFLWGAPWQEARVTTELFGKVMLRLNVTNNIERVRMIGDWVYRRELWESF